MSDTPDDPIAGLRADIAELRERIGLLEMMYASLSRRIDHAERIVRLNRGETYATLPPGYRAAPPADAFEDWYNAKLDAKTDAYVATIRDIRAMLAEVIDLVTKRIEAKRANKPAPTED